MLSRYHAPLCLTSLYTPFYIYTLIYFTHNVESSSTMFSRCSNTMLLSALLRSNDNAESFPPLPCPTSQHRLILSTTLSRRSTSHVPLFSAPFHYKHNAESSHRYLALHETPSARAFETFELLRAESC